MRFVCIYFHRGWQVVLVPCAALLASLELTLQVAKTKQSRRRGTWGNGEGRDVPRSKLPRLVLRQACTGCRIGKRRRARFDCHLSHGSFSASYYNEHGTYLLWAPPAVPFFISGATVVGLEAAAVLTGLLLVAAEPASFFAELAGCLDARVRLVAVLPVVDSAAAAAAAVFAAVTSADLQSVLTPPRCCKGAERASTSAPTFSLRKARRVDPAVCPPTDALDPTDAAAPLFSGAIPNGEPTRPVTGALPAPFIATGANGDLRRVAAEAFDAPTDDATTSSCSGDSDARPAATAPALALLAAAA